MKNIKKLFVVLLTPLLLSGCISQKPDSSQDGYTVSFDTHGGSAVETMENVLKIEESPLTTRQGYEFLGWYDSETYIEEIEFPYEVKSDITLHAGWQYIKTGHTVTFVSNGGSEVASLSDVTILTSLPETTKTFYRFEGWCLENTSEATPITLPYTVSKDVTLYAKWTFDDTMSENVWTDAVKENKVTLVGNQKGSALDDFNFLRFYATRDDKGIYFYVDQRVSGELLHSSDENWWENNNFEFHVNNVATWGGFQLYGSTLDSGLGYNFNNFGFSINKYNREYDLWTIIRYKAFASYEKLSSLGEEVTYDKDTSIYIWYGSNSGHGFDHCDSWEHDAAVKLTVNGIVDVDNVKYATDYEHNRGGWNDLFVEIDDSIQDKERSYLAIHSNAALTCNEDSIADIVWRTTLLAMMNSDRTAGSVFRLDWYHFDHNFTPDAFENGSIWEYDAKTINDTYKYLEVVRDCDIVYTVSRDGNVYNMCTSIFPAKADLVGRGDYVLRQSVTTSTQLGAYIVCEWTNFTAFKK